MNYAEVNKRRGRQDIAGSMRRRDLLGRGLALLAAAEAATLDLSAHTSDEVSAGAEQSSHHWFPDFEAFRI